MVVEDLVHHLHLKEGVERCRARGLATFRAMARCLADSGMTSPASRRSSGWRAPVRQAFAVWAGLVRPQLGELRRGHFDRLRIDRTGADIPAGRGLREAV